MKTVELPRTRSSPSSNDWSTSGRSTSCESNRGRALQDELKHTHRQRIDETHSQTDAHTHTKKKRDFAVGDSTDALLPVVIWPSRSS